MPRRDAFPQSPADPAAGPPSGHWPQGLALVTRWKHWQTTVVKAAPGCCITNQIKVQAATLEMARGPCLSNGPGFRTFRRAGVFSKLARNEASGRTGHLGHWQRPRPARTTRREWVPITVPWPGRGPGSLQPVKAAPARPGDRKNSDSLAVPARVTVTVTVTRMLNVTSSGPVRRLWAGWHSMTPSRIKTQ